MSLCEIQLQRRHYKGPITQNNHVRSAANNLLLMTVYIINFIIKTRGTGPSGKKQYCILSLHCFRNLTSTCATAKGWKHNSRKQSTRCLLP